jgi:hypothetical protein
MLRKYENNNFNSDLRHSQSNFVNFQVVDFAGKAPERVSVPELMQQLQVTQDQLENLRVSIVG